MTEHRTFRNVEIRAGDDVGPNGRPVVTVQAIRPGVVDDYGSLWNAATFDTSVRARTEADPHDTPALCWAHNWSDPIGHGIGYEASADGPRLAFELDDFDAVPRARQADAQIRSRTVRDCSVGFTNTTRREPSEEERRDYPGVKEIIEQSDLDEVSLVIRGVVPGAKVLALRTAAGQLADVPEELVIDLARQIAAGTLDTETARIALDLAAGSPAPEPEPVSEPEPVEPDVEAIMEELGLERKRP